MVDLNGEPGGCDVCGRSMLAGEQTRTYVTRDREEREVCALCVVRAESAGWIQRELAGVPAPERREGGGAVRRLFGRARESAASTLSRPDSGEPTPDRPDPEPDPAPEPAKTTPTRARRRREAPRRPAPESAEPASDGDTAPAERPRRRSVPQKPERRIRRAFEAFNATEHPGRVKSLIRSLGGPYVCAVTTAETPSEVKITVAWELSWYQYEVDLTAEGEAVRELGRGEELAQLSPEDQAWNAHAAEDGELRTGLIGSEAVG